MITIKMLLLGLSASAISAAPTEGDVLVAFGFGKPYYIAYVTDKGLTVKGWYYKKSSCFDDIPKYKKEIIERRYVDTDVACFDKKDNKLNDPEVQNAIPDFKRGETAILDR